MTSLVVDTAAGLLSADGRAIDCVIGRSGAIAAEAKTEGDGCTPLGLWPLQAVLLRPDRIEKPAGIKLPWRWVARADGWSDDPADPAYNRPVRLPHPFSAETLWREDSLYDVIVVLGHNDAPPEAGKGSAIFLHLWNEGQATEGCVAIAREEMAALLPLLMPGDAMEIR